MLDNGNGKVSIMDYINTYRAKNNLSIRGFAIKADLSKSYAHYLCKGERENAGIQVLEKIAHATEVSLKELLEVVAVEDDEELTERKLKINKITDIINQITSEDDLEKILAYVELFIK